MENKNKTQYIFFGKVHPARTNVSISEIHSEIDFNSGEIKGHLQFSISLSHVSATFTSNRSLEDIYTLKNIVEDSIRVALDILGYVLSCGYDLEIIQMVDTLGNPPVVFGVGIPAIEGSAKKAGIEFENIIKIFTDSRGQYLQLCLADLREAIRAPKDTGFFCYRAIESLRHFFQDEKGVSDNKKSWEVLRADLSINRDDIDFIKKFADPIRHGASVPISDKERAKVFETTWNIVNKYIKYAINKYE